MWRTNNCTVSQSEIERAFWAVLSGWIQLPAHPPFSFLGNFGCPTWRFQARASVRAGLEDSVCFSTRRGKVMASNFRVIACFHSSRPCLYGPCCLIVGEFTRPPRFPWPSFCGAQSIALENVSGMCIVCSSCWQSKGVEEQCIRILPRFACGERAVVRVEWKNGADLEPFYWE